MDLQVSARRAVAVIVLATLLPALHGTLAAGASHLCALTGAGEARCWGWNQYGQVGDGTTKNRSTPVEVTGLGSGVAALVGGGSHTCALLETDAVKCWGWNLLGQLGDRTTVNQPTPVDAHDLTGGVVAIAAGATHTCALLHGGAVKC
jgi:alpha-tubulin suppressor-like RCC1 family protein